MPVMVQLEAMGLLGKSFSLEGRTIPLDEHALFKAAVKCGGAVTHVAVMFQHQQHAAIAGQYI